MNVLTWFWTTKNAPLAVKPNSSFEIQVLAVETQHVLPPGRISSRMLTFAGTAVGNAHNKGNCREDQRQRGGILTAAFVPRNLADGNSDRLRSVMVESSA